MEIFSPGLLRVGSGERVQFNRFGNLIHFGNTQTQDTFQSTSVNRFFNENEIKKMISQNPEIRKIMVPNKMPVKLNMEELHNLQQNHCKDTQEIAANIAANLQPALKSKVNLKDLKDGAMLHDFGKALIPQEILNKNGALTEEEHRIMDLHSELGYQLLKNSGVNDEVLKLVRFHHNNFEKAKQSYIADVNLQILNLADKYSALTEKRVYKEPFSPKKALTILYGDVKKGEVHPFIFQALVKSLEKQQTQTKMVANVN